MPADTASTPFLVSVGSVPRALAERADGPTCEDFHARPAPRLNAGTGSVHTRRTDVDQETTDDE
jgi:hypothetical protein